MSDQNEDLYPEHTKLLALDGKNDVVGDFLDWLESEEIILAQWDEDEQELIYVTDSKTNLIGRYFEIDPRKLDAEKSAMLDAIRAANN